MYTLNSQPCKHRKRLNKQQSLTLNPQHTVNTKHILNPTPCKHSTLSLSKTLAQRVNKHDTLCQVGLWVWGWSGAENPIGSGESCTH